MRIISLLIICTLGCQDREQKVPPIDETSINQVYDIFSKAYRDLDVRMVEEIYADSAIYLNPHDTIQFGKAAFLGSFESMFASAKADSAALDIQFRILDRKLTTDQAIDIGYYHLQQKKGTEIGFTSVGKFITVLRKQKDGSWKFITDGYSPAPVDAW